VPARAGDDQWAWELAGRGFGAAFVGTDQSHRELAVRPMGPASETGAATGSSTPIEHAGGEALGMAQNQPISRSQR
jgi:hypothetical protein